MDIVDIANARADEHLQRDLANHRNRPLETPLVLDGVRVCKDCEEPIEPERLRAVPTAVRCVDCQSRKDPHR